MSSGHNEESKQEKTFNKNSLASFLEEPFKSMPLQADKVDLSKINKQAS